jgi:hypothetical protein
VFVLHAPDIRLPYYIHLELQIRACLTFALHSRLELYSLLAKMPTPSSLSRDKSLWNNPIECSSILGKRERGTGPGPGGNTATPAKRSATQIPPLADDRDSNISAPSSGSSSSSPTSGDDADEAGGLESPTPTFVRNTRCRFENTFLRPVASFEDTPSRRRLRKTFVRQLSEDHIIAKLMDWTQPVSRRHADVVSPPSTASRAR